MSDSLWPCELEPTRLLCPWDSPGKNAGVPFPSPGDLPDPEVEPGSPALQADSFQPKPLGLLSWTQAQTLVKDWGKITGN